MWLNFFFGFCWASIEIFCVKRTRIACSLFELTELEGGRSELYICVASAELLSVKRTRVEESLLKLVFFLKDNFELEFCGAGYILSFVANLSLARFMLNTCFVCCVLEFCKSDSLS